MTTKQEKWKVGPDSIVHMGDAAHLRKETRHLAHPSLLKPAQA